MAIIKYVTECDTGIDLKKVEDDLSNNASNEEEIEAANDGIIGDPVEEAFYIMYESSYNMNELMKAVGIAELKESYSGRELVLEAVDIKAFLSKIAAVIENIKIKIEAIVNKVMTHLLNTSKADKKLFLENKSAIQNGIQHENFSLKGYIFAKDEEIVFNNDIGVDIYNAFNTEYYAARNYNAIPENFSKNYSADKLDGQKNDILKKAYDFYGLTYDKELDAKDLSAKMSKKFRGGKEDPEELRGKITFEDIKAILFESDKTAQTIKADWLKIKDTYNRHIKMINNAAKADKDGNNEMFVIASYYSKLMVFEKNVTNTVIGTVLREAKAKRDQARRAANIAIRLGEKIDKNTVVLPKGESATLTNTFANVKIV